MSIEAIVHEDVSKSLPHDERTLSSPDLLATRLVRVVRVIQEEHIARNIKCIYFKHFYWIPRTSRGMTSLKILKKIGLQLKYLR